MPATTTAPAQRERRVTVTTDTLRVTLDGGNVRNAELLKYPSEAKSTDAGNVTLFDAESRALLRSAERLGQQHGRRARPLAGSCPKATRAT